MSNVRLVRRMTVLRKRCIKLEQLSMRMAICGPRWHRCMFLLHWMRAEYDATWQEAVESTRGFKEFMKGCS